MPASLAAIASPVASPPGAASAVVGLPGLGGDIASAFAGLVGDAQAMDEQGAPPPAGAGGQAAPAEQPSTNASTDSGASALTTSALPTALLGFLTQAQAKNGAAKDQAPSGGDAQTDKLDPSPATVTAASLTQAVAASQAKASPKSDASDTSQATTALTSAAETSAAETSAAATLSTTASSSVFPGNKDAAPKSKSAGDPKASDKGVDKAAAAQAQADAATALIGLMTVTPQPAPASPPAATSAGDGTDTRLTAATPSLPGLPTDDETSDQTAGPLDATGAKGAVGSDALASNKPPPQTNAPAAPQATSSLAATDGRAAVLTPGVASPAGSTAAQAAAAPAASPNTGPPDTAATAQASASASAPQPPPAPSRFAAAKSTAATNFRAAPTSMRSTTAPQASASASSAAAPSASHPESGPGGSHTDMLDAGADGGTAFSGTDASSNTGAPADTGFANLAAAPDAVATPIDTPAAAPSTAPGAETAANLSAQIVQKLAGQNTRFDLQLNPNGLGRVDVAVQIDAKGALSASLSFEKPEAASLLRAHAGDLQQSLSQAGFDLSNASLSFSTADQNGRGSAQSFFAGDFSGGQNANQGGGQGQSAGRAFSAASLAAAQTDNIAIQSQGLSARGVDIRI